MKSFVTNLISFLVFIFGFAFENEILLNIGLFALSGAITNWLAVYMIFEKVPFLYGSGVIEEKFEEFKLSIKKLMMEQFFTKENLEKFLNDEIGAKKIDFNKIIEKLDYEIAFNSLKKAVMESQFGALLNMFGGESALEGLKEPFKEKLKNALINMTNSNSFKQMFAGAVENKSFIDDLNNKIDSIIQKRLDELTPKMVKKMVEEIIRVHLGWLVVWGGVFGGIIGFVSVLLV